MCEGAVEPAPLPGFPAATRDEWMARVSAVLKGKGFETLLSETADGIGIEPLYGPAVGPRAFKAGHAPWRIVQRVDHPDPGKANEQALSDLENGATGLVLCIAGAPASRGYGLSKYDTRALSRVFDQVRIDAIALRLETGNAVAASALTEFIATQPAGPERLDINFGLDPLTDNSRIVAMLTDRGFRGPFVNADGRRWHDDGATDTEELGFTLACGVTALRGLEQLGDDDRARSIGVTLAAGEDAFLTLAKFRAMRLLWARILESSKLPATPLALHAETSWRMMTARDPHMNILRAMAGVFGAGLGGADSIAVLPFSLAQGLPDGFARRIARNTQSILLEESQLWRAGDPAAGSGYIEHLTGELCARAWRIFQQVERNGGIAAALRDGTVQRRIEKSRMARKERIEQGRETIIGVTAFTTPGSHKAAIEKDIPRGVTAARIAEAFEGHAL